MNNFGSANPECARPLAACVDFIGGPVLPGALADPNAFPTGAQQILQDLNGGLSDSHQFQLTVDKRFSDQFALRAAYTFSKTIDMTSGFRSRSSQFTDPLDPRLDRSLADFDVPHRLVISGIWTLPFDRGIHSNGFLKKVAEGWQFNGIATYQKGQPLTLFSNNDSSAQDNFLDRPDLIGPIQYLNPRSPSSFKAASATCLGPGNDATNQRFWFNPTAFDCANVAPLTFGTFSRNAIRGPGINNYDLSLTKKTTITESTALEFRAEFFNAFNHPQFLNPDNMGGAGTFGQISTDRGPRLIQFGLKLYF